MQVGARVALGLAWSRTLTCILSQLESTRRASLHVALSAKSTGMLPLATSHSTSSVRREKGIVAAPFRPTVNGAPSSATLGCFPADTFAV